MQTRQKVRDILFQARRKLSHVIYYRGNVRDGINSKQRKEILRAKFGLARIILLLDTNHLAYSKYNPLNHKLPKPVQRGEKRNSSQK